MSHSFDPYHRWLGIPPSRQPPNYYDLLGLQLFENDLDVIDIAGHRQMAHVKSFATGPNAALSQSILNQLAEARLCLLDRTRKAAYDTALRHSQHHRAFSTSAPSSLQFPQSVPPLAEDRTHGGRIHLAPPVGYKRLRKRSTWKLNAAGHIVFSIAGLAAGYLLLASVGPQYDFLNVFHKRGANSERRTETQPDANSPEMTRRTPKAPRVTSPIAMHRSPLDEVNADSEPSIGLDGGAADLSPFVNLVDHIELHNIGQVPAVLGAVPQEAIDELVVSLFPVDGEHALAKRFVTMAPESVGRRNRWPVGFGTAREITSGDLHPSRPVAELVVSDTALLFHWLGDGGNIQRGSIRNCVIEVAHGSNSHFIGLRRPIELGAVTVQCRREPQELVLTVSDLPPATAIYLHTSDLQGFPSMEIREGSGTEARAGERVSWSCLSAPYAGFAVDWEIRRGEVVIRLFAGYVLETEGPTVFSLNGDALVEQEKTGRKNLDERKSNLANRQRVLGPSLDRQLAAVKGMSVHTVPGVVDAGRLAWRNNRIAEIGLAIERNRQAIAALQAVIPSMERDLQRFPTLRSISQQIHGNARVGMTLYTLSGRHRVDLVCIGAVDATVGDAGEPAPAIR